MPLHFSLHGICFCIIICFRIIIFLLSHGLAFCREALASGRCADDSWLAWEPDIIGRVTSSPAGPPCREKNKGNQEKLAHRRSI